MMQNALEAAKADQGQVFGGERVTVAGCEDGYCSPFIVEMPKTEHMHHEVFGAYHVHRSLH